MKYFLFDIGNVLFNFDFYKMHQTHSQHSGAPVKPYSAEEFAVRDQVESGFISDEEWLKYLNSIRNLSWTMDDLVQAWIDNFEPNQTGIQLFKKAIAQKEVSVHVLSNISNHHILAIERAWPNFFDGADSLFFSYEMGTRKPSSTIYQKVLNQLGVPAETCFFVDDMSENVEAARKLGIQAHQFIPQKYKEVQHAVDQFFG